MTALKLFAIYVGGETANSHVELHDMRFVIAENIKATYPQLQKEWWGTPDSLHLDCWGEITHADGHKVSLQTTPPKDRKQHLYFVNLGGYDPEEFTELHKNVFVIAENESKAKVKALQMVMDKWKSPHKDYLYDIEKCFCLDDIAKEKSLYIHLEPSDTDAAFKFTCKYVPIGEKLV